MPRHYSEEEYNRLAQQISDLIQRKGYVPPVREIAEELSCSASTAWKITRTLGWAARGRHHWDPVKTEKGPAETDAQENTS